MPQLPMLKCKGMYTHPNELGSVPDGALLVAQNCVVDREDILENMRGSRKYGDVLADFTDALFNYRDRLIAQHGSTLSYDSDGAGTWADYTGSFSPPTGRKMRSFESNQNFYFTTTEGVKKIDSLTSTPIQAGIPKALDGTAALAVAGSGFLPLDNQIAYRVVWGLEDLNENLILGAPSQRFSVVNPSGGASADNVDIEFTIPDGITVNHIYQVYRSQASGGDAITANDELQLAYEGNPSAGEITAKLVTLTDITTDTLLGATLYTSPSQEGIAQANDEPPFAKDVAVYRDHAIYANTQTVQNLTLTLIGTGSPSLQIGDTITIDGDTFTGAAAENIGSQEFKVFTGGTPADDIEDTAISLIRVINRQTSGVDIYGYYTSGYKDLPGKMWFKDRVQGGSAWAVTSSRGAAFSPILPSSGTTVSSSNEEKKNRVYIAKFGQPEGVPFGQFEDAGSADKDIYRVVALRDSVFILKADGIYRMTGTSIGDFQITLFDNTAFLFGIETAVALNNQVFAYTTQGVTAISDTGVQVMSRPIEKDLTRLSSDLYPDFKSISFALAYETERKYILFTPTIVADTYATQCWVYNTFTNAWTFWKISRGAAVINTADDRIFAASAEDKYIRRNRKDFVITDYADDEYSLTIVSGVGTTIEVNSTTDAVVGQTLYQASDGTQAVVTEVTDATHLEVDRTLGWAPATSATLYDPYEVSIRWAPIHGGNPGLLKQFSEAVFFFKKALFASINAIFGTNFVRTGRDSALVPKAFGSAFGDGAFDDGVYGAQDEDLQPIRTYIPLEQQRGNWLDVYIEHEEACTHFALEGLGLVMTPMETRFR